MNTNAQKVVQWIKDNLPPISWNTLVLANVNMFLHNNVKPGKINDDTVFNREIMAFLKSEIKTRYNKDLPNYF